MVSIQTILLGAFALAQTVSATTCNFREGEVIALKADTGYYATRCRNCVGGTELDSVSFQGPINSGTPYSYWTIVDAGDGKIALKGDLGTISPDATTASMARLTPTRPDNGKIALKADTGKYLARCNNCIKGGPADVAFVHAAYWKESP
ncbi:unnamed protein product [Aphanomyces euteiches]